MHLCVSFEIVGKSRGNLRESGEGSGKPPGPPREGGEVGEEGAYSLEEEVG